MITIDGCTAEQAGDALVRLARNVPPDVPVGRPLVAAPVSTRSGDGVQILDSDGTCWFVYSASVERVIDLGGISELTGWFGGVESAHIVGATG